MENVSRIMHRIGKVFNVLFLIMGGIMIFAGLIALVAAGISGDSSSDPGSLLFSGFYFGIFSLLALINVGKARRRINRNIGGKRPHISTIIWGALSFNPFYVLSGIFGCIASNNAPRTTYNPAPQPRVEPAPAPRVETNSYSSNNNNASVNLNKDNPRTDVNGYGDIILSYEAYQKMVKSNNCACITMGTVEIANANGSFNLSNMNINGNIMRMSLNGINREYDLSSGLKGILIIDNQIYLGFQGVKPSKNSIKLQKDNEPDTAKTFGRGQFDRVIINAKKANIDIYEDEDVNGFCEVMCDDGFESSISKTGILTIDTGDRDDDLSIALHSSNARGYKIEINTESADIDISEIECDKLKIKTSSGDIDASITTTNLVISSESGDVDITHTYNDDGAARISTISGDISYEVKSVKNLNLSSVGDCENYFESDDDGYFAEVHLSSESGSITVD